MATLPDNQIAENRRARFDYEILDTVEAGIELEGHEVKSAKAGRMNIAGSYVIVRGGEAWLLNGAITPVQPKNVPPGYVPDRTRRLLLHREEIKRLQGKANEDRLTLVPLRAYVKRGLVKLALGIGKSKRTTDKRETIKKRDAERDMGRARRR